MTARTTWLLLLLVSALIGCRTRGSETPKDPPAICALVLPEHLHHVKADALPAEIWLALLFKGWADGVPRDAVDCSGEPIRWDSPATECLESEPEGKLLPSEQPTAEDLIIRNAGGDYWFGWAPWRHYDNGMAEGPIVIARTRGGMLEARALGTLRGYPGRARLEVRRMGDSYVLSAEGEHCDRGEDEQCSRGQRLMLLERQRFRPRPIRSASVRTCLGPAWFPVREYRSRMVAGHWKRELQRDLSLAFEDATITVDEHIVVNDRDLERPSLPPRLFREAQSRLEIEVVAGELLSEGQSLWQAIQIDDGSTEAEGDSPGRDTAIREATPGDGTKSSTIP